MFIFGAGSFFVVGDCPMNCELQDFEQQSCPLATECQQHLPHQLVQPNIARYFLEENSPPTQFFLFSSSPWDASLLQLKFKQSRTSGIPALSLLSRHLSRIGLLLGVCSLFSPEELIPCVQRSSFILHTDIQFVILFNL